MQKALQKIFLLFRKVNPPRKTRAQSLVEVAITFPILIMLFTGMIEFGFILNTYLSLLDATRDSARLYSNDDPFLADGTTDDPDFYYQTAYLVQRTLDPLLDDGSYVGRRIILDPTLDDVIVSVYGSNSSGTVLWRDGGPYHLFPTAGSAGNYPSLYTASAIQATRVAGAPAAGFLLVEVHYNYHHILRLPWLTAWIPNPLHLQAYSIMSIRAGEPTTP